MSSLETTTVFPGAIDVIPDPASNTSSSGDLNHQAHNVLHGVENDSIIAIENYLLQSQGPGPSYNFTPDNLPNFRKAVAGVRTGARQGRILFVGDSITYGYNIYQHGGLGYPKALQSMMGTILPTEMGMAIPDAGIVQGNPTGDNRWTVGTGWTDQSASYLTVPFSWANSYIAYTAVGGTSGALTYTPGTMCDSMDVYFAYGTGSGTYSLTPLSGGVAGTPVTGTSHYSSFAVAKVTVPFTRGTNNTLSILNTDSTNGQDILGVEAYDSTTPKMLFANAAVSGSTAQQWSAGAFAGVNATDCMATYHPDLTVIALGTNDFAAIPATAAQVNGWVQPLITAAKLSGDVVLVIPYVNSPAGGYGVYTTALQAQVPPLKALYLASGLPAVDIYDRWGGQNPATSLAMGFFNTDDLHGSPAGYADMGAAFFAALRQVM